MTTDHATAAAQFAAAVNTLQRERFTISQRVAEMALLELAHAARALDPTAHHVYLNEHDESDCMTFAYVAGDTYWWGLDSTKSGDNQREMDDADFEEWDERARALDASDVGDQEFWIEDGSRAYGRHGELLVQVVLDTYGPKYRTVTDPMPDPTDLAAVRVWLDRQEATA